MTACMDLLGIAGSGGGKDSGGSASEEENTLLCNSIARVIDVLCWGPIGGLVNGAKSIFLDNTALQNEAGEYNFEGVTWHERLGLPDQDPIPDFTEVESEVSVGVEITKDNPVTRTVTETDIDSVRVTILLPSLMQVDGSGNITGTSVELAISVRPSGGSWLPARAFEISGKTNTSYERALRIDDIRQCGEGPWDIKVERLTDDAENSKTQNQTYWQSYTLLIDERFSMPDTAAVGAEINAKQFGSHIPVRGYEIYGLSQIKIPTNYDPASRAYTGAWDGTFKSAWTDNPAWCFFDFLIDDRYGAAIPEERLEPLKWALYGIAQYCDELVPSGYKDAQGEDIPEPRWTMNCCIQTQEEAYHVINALASAFLAIPFWGSGSVALSMDAPGQASHLATPANVLDGDFSYSGTAVNATHSVALVTWTDPGNEYKSAIEVVEDPDLIAKYGYRTKDVLAVGCARRSQAIRYGRFILETEKREGETVTFTGGFDFADCAPGSLIKVQDPHYAGVRFGGRILAGSTNFLIVLDSPVTLESGEAYGLSVVLPNGAVEEKPVFTPPGEWLALNVEPFSSAPQAGAVWVLSATSLVPRYFRVLSNAEEDKHQFKITALLHDPMKYPKIYHGLNLESPPASSSIPTGAVSAPSGLCARSFSYSQGSAYALGANLSWRQSNDPRVISYEAEYRQQGGEWVRAGSGSNPSVDCRGIPPGEYDFRVRCRGLAKSGWATLRGVSVAWPDHPVPDVTGLEVVGGGAEFTGKECDLAWADVRGQALFPVQRFRDYRVQVLDMVDAVKRTRYVKDEGFTYSLWANKKDFGSLSRQFKISVRARDINGNLSANACTLEVSKPAPDLSGYSPTLEGGYNGCVVRLDGFPLDPEDLKAIRVYGGTDPAALALKLTLAPDAREGFLRITVPAGPALAYYVKLVPVDHYGAGAESAVSSVELDPEEILTTLGDVGGGAIEATDLMLKGDGAGAAVAATPGEDYAIFWGTRKWVTGTPADWAAQNPSPQDGDIFLDISNL